MGDKQAEIKIYEMRSFIRKNQSGVVDKDHAYEIALDLARTLGENPGCNVLLDLRETDLPEGYGVNDVIELADQLEPLKPLFKNKWASLIPDTLMRIESANLLKSLLELKGFEYEVFVDYEAAIEWLSEVRSA